METQTYQTDTYDTDVLIVGAGPVGLMAACELARCGISCRIIEKARQRSRLSRAIIVQPRTLEILALLGLERTFLQKGFLSQGLNVGFTDARKNDQTTSVDFHYVDTRFPYLLFLPQDETEELLEAYLSARGITVERGVTWQRCITEQTCVTSQALLADGQTASIRSRYLIACDGSHSDVRTHLGIPFLGKNLPLTFFLCDAYVESGYVKGHLFTYAMPRGLGIIIPLREYVRFVALDYAKQEQQHTDELTLEEMQDSLDALLPRKIELREPRWLGRFGVAERQATHYRSGRVFLAGDAAHVHTPAGGQGMNVGLQDAYNLAWKLALVLKAQAPGMLLETYQEERHRIGTQIERFTGALFRNFLLKNRWLKALRNVAIHTLVPLPAMQRRLGASMAEIRVNYRFSQLSRQQRDAHLSHKAAQAGDRVPDIELASVEEPELWLYSHLRTAPAYTLLIFVSILQLRQEGDASQLAHSLEQVRQQYSATIQPSIVIDEGLPEGLPAEIPTFVDQKHHLRDKLGVRHQSVLLIRPDAYVAFHTQGWDWDKLAPLFQPWVSQEDRLLSQKTAYPLDHAVR
ncbi:MAG: FAD-dependent monooxygenase [Chloroflexi bacterium]|nr:FAD-dependent monooxygenase [Chloroflexota bacterium]